MDPNTDASGKSAELRRRAEERLRRQPVRPGSSVGGNNRPRTLHELQVHEIELQIQNEELQETRARLEALLQRYTELYDFAPDGYLTLRLDGSIRESNVATAALLGVERAALPGAELLSFVAPDDQPAFVATLASARKSGLRHSCELALHKGTTARFLRLSAIRSGGGAELLVALADITARRDAEEARHLIERKMLQAQKLESLGVVAGGVAHDFNNLLMSILGNANLAAGLVPPEGKAREYLDVIELASRRAAALCRQLLAYAGQGRFAVAPVDLSALLREMPQLLGVSISKQAELHYDLPEGLPAIEGDADQLRQVAMNLIINASEALNGRNGQLRIATGTMHGDATCLGSCCPQIEAPDPGPFVFLEVADTGCGMDAATQARMFDPFFSTKFTGRGLGLAALLGIVRRHRGTLQVRSEPGRGTTIRVLLPVAAAATVAPAAPALPAPAAQGHGSATVLPAPAAQGHGSATVLVVDDEKIVRNVLANALTQWGYSVRLADEGRAAVELLRAEPARIGAAILDLHMPQMSGEEAFQELRRIRPDLKVIFSSGNCDDAVKRRLLAAGVVAILEKPFDVDELHRTLGRALAAAPAALTGA